MDTQGINTAGWRGSRDLWLDTALAALVDGGVDAVKIQPLAERLRLSRTSFYWFFKDRKALLSALLDEWDSKNTEGLVSAARAYAESPAEAVLNVISIFHDTEIFDSRLDFAVRSWALQDSKIMVRVNETDDRRLTALREMLERFGFPPDEADVRARNMYLVQIGYISMQVRESDDTRMRRVPAYVKVFTGGPATDKELARFYARHGYMPQS